MLFLEQFLATYPKTKLTFTTIIFGFLAYTGILLVEHQEQTLGFIVLAVFSSLTLMSFALLFSDIVETLFD